VGSNCYCNCWCYCGAVSYGVITFYDGFIGLNNLFGVVVNNAIILIGTVNRHTDSGVYPEQAIVQASSPCFTLLLLATLTTVVSLLTLFRGRFMAAVEDCDYFTALCFSFIKFSIGVWVDSSIYCQNS